MSEMAEVFGAMKELQQQKRASNRSSSAQLLSEASISYQSNNAGAHLIVTAAPRQLVDFWPGTGLWIVRGSGQRQRGVRGLIAFCRKAAAAGAQQTSKGGCECDCLS